MIIADENIPGFIINNLRANGIEVIAIREFTRGAKDETVIQIVQQHNFLLLTEDKDFGEWVFAHHIRDISVIFLRYSFGEFQQISQAILQVIKTYQLERPFFATVTTKKIRVRKL